MKKRFALAATLCAALLLAVSPVLAHDMWITLDNPQVDKPLHIVAGYGHTFPDDEGTDKERLTPAYVLGSRGEVAAKPGQGLDFVTVKPLPAGSYLVVGGRSAQWYSKTPEGYKDLPKSKCPEALKCLRSAKYAKAVLNLGGAAGDVSRPVGQTLEVVPLANPAALKPGGELPVKVLFEGKPLANAEVFASFAGFSGRKNTFAFFSKTDNEGMAWVKPWHPGLWMVVAKYRTPFADPKECDEDMHAASLTFEVK